MWDVGGVKGFSVLLIVRSNLSQCGAEPTVHCLTVEIVQHVRLLQWFGSKDRRIRRPLASFSPISWSFIASNGSLLDLGAHLGKAGSGLVLGLQRGSSQDEDKDEVMSQRMQYYTKRPYYQALNPIIQSQSPPLWHSLQQPCVPPHTGH